MTLGWQVDDYIDRWNESVPPWRDFPQSPEPYRCPFCPGLFETASELQDHLTARHRGSRPVLLLNGVEPVGTHRVAAPLRAADIAVENCTSGSISVDGKAATSISLRELRSSLSRQGDALVELELVNAFDKVAQPIRQGYRLAYRIATRAELEAVDRLFRHHLAVDAPTWGAIDRFLLEPCCRGAARDYAGALAAYVRGILLKDRPAQVTVTLPYSTYRELYGQALEVLPAYDGPLSRLVWAIIRFGRNDFRSAGTPVGSPTLDYANAMLARIAGIGNGPTPDGGAPSHGSLVAACPIDDGIARVLGLAVRLRDAQHWSGSLEEECRQAASAVTLDVPDREKVLALWASAALRLGAHKSAQEPLALLSATYPFDLWAGRERERSTLP
jgi:hypothetical protein